MMEKPIFSVSELNEYVQLALSRDPNLSDITVQGEISGFHRHSSGHLYFTLKDEKAAVKCVMFKGAALRLRFVPKDGAHVQIRGQASIYQKDGSFQVYCSAMTELGAGALYLRFLQLKEELSKKGYFDEDRKKSIPMLPYCVGIVTSPTGAAISDIMNVIGRRFPSMGTKLYPCAVQGTGAAQEIARAIDAANAEKACDVLIVGRGGGSMEDLWAFNELAVAEAIYRSEIPIISAVGHEIDFSISDFTADLRAPTPSAAAELAVPERDALKKQLFDNSARLNNALKSGIERKRAQLELLYGSASMRRVENELMQQRQLCDELNDRLKRGRDEAFREGRNRLFELSLRLNANSPQAALKRGFTLVTDDRELLVASANSLQIGTMVTVHFADGKVSAKTMERSIYEREEL